MELTISMLVFIPFYFVIGIWFAAMAYDRLNDQNQDGMD